MNALLTLLIRHGLAALGGFFAAHGIDGSTTTGIVVGLVMFGAPTAWSWIAKALRIDDSKPGFMTITTGEMLRVLIGSLVSQGITALSVYFATDANNPELLGVAVVNAGLSKVGAHQKLAFIGAKDALKLLALSSSLFALCSCASFSKQDAITMGQRIALSAGDTAVTLAQLKLTQAQLDLAQAIETPSTSYQTIVLKQLALSAAQEGLKAAQEALKKERARLDKQPRDVQPIEGSAGAPARSDLLPLGDQAGAPGEVDALKEACESGGIPACLFMPSNIHDRENRYSSEPHKLASGGSTPPPVSIPHYGQRVAFALSNGAVR